ncbi:hypothetical protein BEL05_10865 [Shewanella colwelliana]|uniref:Uncharacterized protein n=2 Tax=Shewanella colwelliana TaxID=23 RepID=A0A1E5IQG2_SHECO|nr:hypothetical protein BEL05_10865 [Shewanella colwelliana]
MCNLTDIVWHDLPLDGISIKTDSLDLMISPYNESTKQYDELIFKLYSFASMALSLDAQLDISNLKDMEISSFEYSQNKNTLSGTIGILPGNAGFWSVSFKDAQWSIHAST